MQNYQRLLAVLVCLFMLLAFGCSDDDDSSNESSTDLEDNDDLPVVASAKAGDDDDNDDDNDDNNDDTSFPDFDPANRGGFEVGNKTFVFIDENRHDPVTNSSRTLVTEVWYPAADEAADMPRDSVRSFLGDWDTEILQFLSDEGVPPEEILNFDQETDSARDAPIADTGAPYPVIVFSHGNGGVRFQNWTMCEYLASHGYVVVAPDHTGNALASPIPGNLIIFDEKWVFISFWQRKDDLSFLITKMLELNDDDPDGFFTGKLDPNAIGAFGHSFGGTAAVETTRHDHRILATIDMSSFMFPWKADMEASLMFMFGLEDNTMEDAIWLFRYDYLIAPAPKFKMEFFNGGHYTFTDVCLLMPSFFGDGDGCGMGERRNGGAPFAFIEHDEAFAIINSYATAFFGFNLRGQDNMMQYLTTNQFEGNVYLTGEFQ